jgi:hypothetical protein
MRLSVARLLEGVSQTLLEDVLPQVTDRPARGRLYAAVDVLRNLEKRVQWLEAPLAAEVESAGAALHAVAAGLREGGAPELATRLDAASGAWPGAPAEARAAAARAGRGAAFAVLAEAPPPLAAALRPLLGGHLAAQAVRDLALLAPGSLLEEISRG